MVSGTMQAVSLAFSGGGQMRFMDVHMGLLGLELASKGRDGWNCLGRVLGSSSALKFYPYQANASNHVDGGDPDLLTGYFGHRDLVLWGSSPTLGERAGDILAQISKNRPRAVILVSTPSAITAQKGYAFLRLLAELEREGFGACWLRVGAVDMGLPHDAYYTIIVAVRLFDGENVSSLFASIGQHLGIRASLDREYASLNQELGAALAAFHHTGTLQVSTYVHALLPGPTRPN